MKVGAMLPLDREIELNKGRDTREVIVSNTGDRPIQVGSHFHFFETNKLLAFDRQAAFGYRLDIPSGTSVRFEPGEEVKVKLTEIGGSRTVYGLNDLTCGQLEEIKDQALGRMQENGFQKEQ